MLNTRIYGLLWALVFWVLASVFVMETIGANYASRYLY